MRRKANMELFRIVLMISIVFGHGFRWGGLRDALTFPSILYIITQILDIIDTPAVNCFVMLSGYFLITTDFKVSRILKLWLQILFYSVVLCVLMCFCGQATFSPKSVALSVIPVISNRYWFATNYVALYLLFPFINILLNKLDKRQYQVMLAVEFFLFSLVSMIPGVPGFNSLGGNSLIWFVVLYTIGGYLRKFPTSTEKEKNQQKKLVLEYIGMILLMFVLSEAVMWLTGRLTGERQAGARITGYTSILCVITCVIIFRIFEGIRIEGKAAKIITAISPLCFGVYLIHEHPAIRHPLWDTIGLGWAADKWWLPLGMIGEAIAVFVFCAVIEYGRQKLFGLIPGRVWNAVDEKCNKLIRCELK